MGMGICFGVWGWMGGWSDVRYWDSRYYEGMMLPSSWEGIMMEGFLRDYQKANAWQ